MDTNSLLSGIKLIPAIIIGLTVHEFTHAFIAYKLGDTTAKDDGRLTLNPIKHIDIVGFIMIFIAGFGWAKPVLVNPAAYKNPKRDEIAVSVAGPISNLLVAVFFLLLIKVWITIDKFSLVTDNRLVFEILTACVSINLGLFVFNLLPVPPLDGSHLYLAFMKNRFEKLTEYLTKYGLLVLLFIIIIEKNMKIDIIPIGKLITALLGFLTWAMGF